MKTNGVSWCRTWKVYWLHKTSVAEAPVHTWLVCSVTWKHRRKKHQLSLQQLLMEASTCRCLFAPVAQPIYQQKIRCSCFFPFFPFGTWLAAVEKRKYRKKVRRLVQPLFTCKRTDNIMEKQKQQSEPRFQNIRIEKNVKIPMRDGVHLYVDLYFPSEANLEHEKMPVLLTLSCYGKDFAHLPACASFRFRETGPMEFYVKRGYIYCIGDVRGSGQSREGVWKFFDKTEQEDIYDIVEWLGGQSWCNGKVTFKTPVTVFWCLSWRLEWQANLTLALFSGWLLCKILHTWHALRHMEPVQVRTTVFPIMQWPSFTDMYRDLCYHGGIFSESLVFLW